MAKKKISKRNLRAAIIFTIILIIIVVAYYYIIPQFLNKNETASLSALQDSVHGEQAGNGDLKLHIISVGQADSIFIEFPTGNCMLIDAGEKKTAEKVVDYIKNLGYSAIDYVLLTHQDSDHAGGMVDIYNQFEVENSIRPACYSSNKNAVNLKENFNFGCNESGFYQSTSATYYNYLKAVQDENTDWNIFNKDSYINFSFTANEQTYECKMDFLTPTADINQIKYKEANNFSPIILLEYSGKKILLTGDAEKDVENELLNFYADDDLDVDVLKVGHHGSKTSSSEAFIQKIKPEFSLISCGYDPESNKKCPWQITLDTLVMYKSIIYRTDYQGNIVLSVSIDGEINIDTEKDVENYSLLLSGYSA